MSEFTTDWLTFAISAAECPETLEAYKELKRKILGSPYRRQFGDDIDIEVFIDRCADLYGGLIHQSLDAFWAVHHYLPEAVAAAEAEPEPETLAAIDAPAAAEVESEPIPEPEAEPAAEAEPEEVAAASGADQPPPGLIAIRVGESVYDLATIENGAYRIIGRIDGIAAGDLQLIV